MLDTSRRRRRKGTAHEKWRGKTWDVTDLYLLFTSLPNPRLMEWIVLRYWYPAANKASPNMVTNACLDMGFSIRPFALVHFRRIGRWSMLSFHRSRTSSSPSGISCSRIASIDLKPNRALSRIASKYINHAPLYARISCSLLADPKLMTHMLVVALHNYQ